MCVACKNFYSRVSMSVYFTMIGVKGRSSMFAFGYGMVRTETAAASKLTTSFTCVCRYSRTRIEGNYERKTSNLKRVYNTGIYTRIRIYL